MENLGALFHPSYNYSPPHRKRGDTLDSDTLDLPEIHTERPSYAHVMGIGLCLFVTAYAVRDRK